MMLREFIAEVVSGEVDVVGDHEIAFESAFGAEPGAIVSSGTGSIA
jgi:N-acetylglucosamine kinase-like BadF-type ATPase